MLIRTVINVKNFYSSENISHKLLSELSVFQQEKSRISLAYGALSSGYSDSQI